MEVITKTPVGTAQPATIDLDEVQDRPFGFAAATLMAGGFGVALFGVVTLVSERFVGTQTGLTLSTAIGPLSGKVVYGVAGWLIGYALLALILRNRNVSETVTYWITSILVAIGFLLTFPSVWKLLGA
jgi:hypothetical protein